MNWDSLSRISEQSKLNLSQQFSLSKYRLLLEQETDINVVRELTIELTEQLMRKENIIAAIFSELD